MISRFAADLGQPVGAQVVELLAIDLGDGGGVRAADVVGLDLEPRDRVGVGPLREQQVAALLEGVGLLRARSTLIIPRHTAVARSASTPRKARSEVVWGAACSWVVSKSRCWRPAPA